MKKKLLSLILAIVTIAAIVPAAFAADVVETGSCGTSATWSFDSDGTLTVEGTGEIFFNAYSVSDTTRNTMRKVIILPGITSIAAKSFTNCISVNVVYIPVSMQKFGAMFVGCDNISDVYYGGTEAQWNQLCSQGYNPMNNGFVNATMHYGAQPADVTAPAPVPGTTLAPANDFYDIDSAAGTTTFHVFVGPPLHALLFWSQFLGKTSYTAEVYIYDSNGVLIRHNSVTVPINGENELTIDVPVNSLLYVGNQIRVYTHF